MLKQHTNKMKNLYERINFTDKWMCCRTILATTDFFSQYEATNRADMIVYIVVFLKWNKHPE